MIMGFTELSFLFVFLPVSVVIYLACEWVFHNVKLNNAVLVVMSFVFYWWANKEAVIAVLLLCLFVYVSGHMLENRDDGIRADKRKRLVRVPVILTVGLLAFYKYVSLIAEWINRLADMTLISVGHLIVPIGISFIVFEAVSYLVDICRGDAQAGSLLECFTFLSLFPKIVSGPIVLWKDCQSQLRDRRSTLEKTALGIDRIIIGYAKKAVIADTLGMQIALIDRAMAGTGVDIPTVWLKVILFSLQLYFDFSGYSDIAIGLSGIFGFSFRENFDYPYLSGSVTEFWRRWHISLGSWFREYVYIPLGGNRKGNVYLHLLIVFILTGLWHGTGIHFLVWGLLHGLATVFERAVRDRTWYRRMPVILKGMLTCVFVCLAWILFMSRDISSAVQTFKYLFAPMTAGQVNYTWRYYLSGRTVLLIAVAVAGHVFGIRKLNAKARTLLGTRGGTVVRRVALLLLFAVDILYVVNSTYSPFIYFQF